MVFDYCVKSYKELQYCIFNFIIVTYILVLEKIDCCSDDICHVEKVNSKSQSCLINQDFDYLKYFDKAKIITYHRMNPRVLNCAFEFQNKLKAILRIIFIFI